MSRNDEEQRECEAIKEDLATIALGIVSGRRRAQVLDHVERCPSCSAELEQLAIVADTLLQLAPEVEPPLGFELRLAQRLQASAPTRRLKSSRRVGALAVAAAVLVVLGFVAGTLVTARSGKSQNQAPTSNVTAASLGSHGQVLGEVFVSAGKPSWLYMTIDSGSWSGAVTCEVILAGGRIEKVGQFNLSNGYGAWGAPLTSPAGQVRGARLIAPNGAVLASASLRT